MRREKDGSFTTSVYRKATHTDRYLHFRSNHLTKDKLSGINTLRYRAEHYCSNKELLRAELKHLEQVFIENDFPEILVRKCLYSKKKKKKPEEEEEETNLKLFVPYVKGLDNML